MLVKRGHYNPLEVIDSNSITDLQSDIEDIIGKGDNLFEI